MDWNHGWPQMVEKLEGCKSPVTLSLCHLERLIEVASCQSSSLHWLRCQHICVQDAVHIQGFKGSWQEELEGPRCFVGEAFLRLDIKISMAHSGGEGWQGDITRMHHLLQCP